MAEGIAGSDMRKWIIALLIFGVGGATALVLLATHASTGTHWEMRRCGGPCAML
jgi:hypothetical protein